jgi:hypothetical protein
MVDSPSWSKSTMPAHTSKSAWQFWATHASQSASDPKAQAKKQLLETQVLWSAKHPTHPALISGNASAMHPSKQALMSLLKKHEKPQSNTASFTMVPSLHSKSKSLELHWA